jgi:hypothetical protein
MVIGRVADVLTIFAAAIAFFGVGSAWLSRPRLTVTADADDANSARIVLAYQKGSSRARNLYYGWLSSDEKGIVHSGDGPNAWRPAIIPGETQLVEVFDPDEVHHMDKPGDHETRLCIKNRLA